MRSAFPRGPARLVPWLASAFVLAALLAALIPLALSSGGSASAANPELTFDLSCSPEQTVGGAVAFKYTLTNTGDEALTKVSVIDDRLGNISIHFPGSLNPTESFEIIRYYIVQESDPRPFTNSATATYDPAAPATDSCTVDVPHLSLTKTATVIDGSTTFTFILTNDGSTWLHQIRVVDSFLGDITGHFPLLLAPGDSVQVEITVPTVEPCDNTVFAEYESVPRSLIVFARADCDRGERADYTAVKECFPETGNVGDPINVKVTVTNIGNVPLTNVTVTDDHAGPLSLTSGDDGDNVLEPGEAWVFTGSYNPGTAGSFTNQAEVSATAPDGTVIIRLTNTDTCVRERPPDGSALQPTDTECADFRDGDLLPLAILYDVRNGAISNVVPGVFFYFTKVSIASTAGTDDQVKIDQSSSLFPEFAIKDAVIYEDPSCSPLAKNKQPNCAGVTDCTFEVGQTGNFIIRVRYDAKSIVGPVVCPPPLETSHYVFRTLVNGSETTRDEIDVTPKPSTTC